MSDEADHVKSPAFQFYPKDFLSDSHVVAMRLPERGAYITLLCLCWLDGSIPSDLKLLARRCQVSEAAFARLWPALEPCFRAQNGQSGSLIQPRIERERQKQETYRALKAVAGQKGGNQKASKRLAEGKQTPSKRLAKASPPSSSSSSSPIFVSDLQSSEREKSVETSSTPSPASVLKDAWNRLTEPPIPRCRDLTPHRTKHVKARLSERPALEWEGVFARIQRSAFCRGENDRGWVASFDWAVGSPDVAVKVLEGKYDNRPHVVGNGAREDVRAGPPLPPLVSELKKFYGDA